MGFTFIRRGTPGPFAPVGCSERCPWELGVPTLPWVLLGASGLWLPCPRVLHAEVSRLLLFQTLLGYLQRPGACHLPGQPLHTRFVGRICVPVAGFPGPRTAGGHTTAHASPSSTGCLPVFPGWAFARVWGELQFTPDRVRPLAFPSPTSRTMEGHRREHGGSVFTKDHW